MKGISHVTSKVYEKHPDVLLDLTFELWGQKHVIDAGLAGGRRSGLDEQCQRWNDRFGRNAAGPHAALRAGALDAGRKHADRKSSRRCTESRRKLSRPRLVQLPLLLGDLRKLSAADQQWYHDHIAWFKQLRKNYRDQPEFLPAGELASAFIGHMGWVCPFVAHR